MKKVFLLGLMVFTTQLVSAQTVSFGLKAGFSRTSINDEQRVEDSGVTPRPAFHAGGLAHIHLTDKWAVQPELMYSKEGANYQRPNLKEKSDINLVNLPILVQYMIGPGFRIQTGPQFGLITGAKFENADNEEFRKGDIQKAAVAWAMGLGYLTKFGLGVDARFNLGLSDIYIKGSHPGQTARLRAGQLGLFYQFNKKS